VKKGWSSSVTVCLSSSGSRVTEVCDSLGGTTMGENICIGKPGSGSARGDGGTAGGSAGGIVGGIFGGLVFVCVFICWVWTRSKRKSQPLLTQHEMTAKPGSAKPPPGAAKPPLSGPNSAEPPPDGIEPTIDTSEPPTDKTTHPDDATEVPLSGSDAVDKV